MWSRAGRRPPPSPQPSYALPFPAVRLSGAIDRHKLAAFVGRAERAAHGNCRCKGPGLGSMGALVMGAIGACKCHEGQPIGVARGRAPAGLGALGAASSSAYTAFVAAATALASDSGPVAFDGSGNYTSEPTTLAYELAWNAAGGSPALTGDGLYGGCVYASLVAAGYSPAAQAQVPNQSDGTTNCPTSSWTVPAPGASPTSPSSGGSSIVLWLLLGAGLAGGAYMIASDRKRRAA